MSRKKILPAVAEVEGNTIVVRDAEKFNQHLKDLTADLALSPTRITKVKLKGRSMYVEYDETINSETDNIKRDCSGLVHQDLMNAMNGLIPHLALITDMREAADLEAYFKKGGTFDMDNMPDDLNHKMLKMHVSGFTIGGDGDSEGIVLIGSKHIGIKVLNLTTPLMQWEEAEQYKFLNQLQTTMDHILREVKMFLFEGKRAMKQLDMDFDSEAGQEE